MESRKFEETSFDFLMAEPSVGLTFSAIALGAEDDVYKIDRNTQNTRCAYDPVLRFQPRLIVCEL